MTATCETIRCDGADRDGIVRSMLHRPERLNAFTNVMQRELCAAEVREGVAAFRDRRAPEFSMRVPDDVRDVSPWWEPEEWGL